MKYQDPEQGFCIEADLGIFFFDKGVSTVVHTFEVVDCLLFRCLLTKNISYHVDPDLHDTGNVREVLLKDAVSSFLRLCFMR